MPVGSIRWLDSGSRVLSPTKWWSWGQLSQEAVWSLGEGGVAGGLQAS